MRRCPRIKANDIHFLPTIEYEYKCELLKRGSRVSSRCQTSEIRERSPPSTSTVHHYDDVAASMFDFVRCQIVGGFPMSPFSKRLSRSLNVSA